MKTEIPLFRLTATLRRHPLKNLPYSRRHPIIYSSLARCCSTADNTVETQQTNPRAVGLFFQPVLLWWGRTALYYIWSDTERGFLMADAPTLQLKCVTAPRSVMLSTSPPSTAVCATSTPHEKTPSCLHLFNEATASPPSAKSRTGRCTRTRAGGTCG